MKRSRRAFLMAAAALAGCPGKAEGTTIRVSAIPDENPTELMRRYAPLVGFLRRSLGAEVSYVPVTDYGAAVQGLASGTVDFAWLGAFTYVQASHQAEVEPLCMRAIDRDFKSVIVGGAARVATMGDLKGKSFAFGSKSSTSGHLMPRHHLKKDHGLEPERDFATVSYTGSHDATVKMVESGRVAAGAVNQLVWKRMVDEKQVDVSRVKVVWTTPGFVDYVWAARTAVPAATREIFRASFLELRLDGPDAAILRLQDAKRFVAASAADFAAVEAVAVSTGLLEPTR